VKEAPKKEAKPVVSNKPAAEDVDEDEVYGQSVKLEG